MRSLPSTTGLTVLFAAAVFVVGCSKSEPPRETERPAAGSAPQATPPAGHDQGAPGAHGDAAEPVTPGGTSHEIWTQIAQEQAKLEAVIQSGEFAKVHHLAFGIRDLVLSLAGKTTPSDATALQKIVDDVRRSAAKLDEYGDSGNLSGVKEEYARFQHQLQSLRDLTGGH